MDINTQTQFPDNRRCALYRRRIEGRFGKVQKECTLHDTNQSPKMNYDISTFPRSFPTKCVKSGLVCVNKAYISILSYLIHSLNINNQPKFTCSVVVEVMEEPTSSALGSGMGKVLKRLTNDLNV